MSLQDKINNLNSVIDQRLMMQNSSNTAANRTGMTPPPIIQPVVSPVKRYQSQQIPSQLMQIDSFIQSNSEKIHLSSPANAKFYYTPGRTNNTTADRELFDSDYWKQKCDNLEEKIQVYSLKSVNPIQAGQMTVKYSLFETEYEKLCQKTNLISHENEMLLFKLKQVQLENMKLKGLTLNQNYLELEIQQLKQENSNLCKQLEIQNEQCNKLKIESLSRQDKCNQLEIQLLQQKQDFQNRISAMEQKAEQDLAMYKQQHIHIVNDQIIQERDELNNHIHHLRLEKDQLALKIAKLEHQLDIQTKDYNQRVSVLEQELETRKNVIAQLQHQNQEVSALNNKMKVDLKHHQNDFLNYHIQKEQELKDMQNQHTYEKTQDDLKLNILVKENDKLIQHLKTMEAKYSNQMIELESYHRNERKKLAATDANNVYNNIVLSAATNDQKVQMLLQELSTMNDRIKAQSNEIEHLRSNNTIENAKLKKDNELWMINTEEIMKEKESLRTQMEQEFNNKLVLVQKRYEEQIASLRAQK